jgi:hypothetical protein
VALATSGDGCDARIDTSSLAARVTTFTESAPTAAPADLNIALPLLALRQRQSRINIETQHITCLNSTNLFLCCVLPSDCDNGRFDELDDDERRSSSNNRFRFFN